MIKLSLPDKPEKLAANEAKLTAEFKADNNKTVWRKDYITAPLLEMTHSKCAYSEVRLEEESKYMEVEHFKHKSKYPDEVVKWGNLLPSCKTCNDSKGTWDVVKNPIVNPLTDTPQTHLYVVSGRFYAKDLIGRTTIDVLDLNNTDNFTMPRLKEAIMVIDHLEEALDALKDADTKLKIQRRTRAIKNILKACGPQSVYSAVVATHIIHGWPGYNTLISTLKATELWDNEFEETISTLKSIALPA